MVDINEELAKMVLVCHSGKQKTVPQTTWKDISPGESPYKSDVLFQVGFQPRNHTLQKVTVQGGRFDLFRKCKGADIANFSFQSSLFANN